MPKVVEVPDRVRVMSVSVAEDEWKKIGTRLTEGLYAAWNYLQSLGGERNKRFVGAFKRRFGMDRVTDDPIEAAYFQVHLFAKARSTDARAIRHAARAWRSTPRGPVRIDPENQHTWNVARVRKILSDGPFGIVWSSDHPLQPRPYPEEAVDPNPPARGG